MKNQIRGKKGITLIALVITIIVLLILAGVTIATLTGDNGLLQKAASLKQASEKGEIEEQIKLAYNDWKLRKETGEIVDLQNTVQTSLDKTYENVTISKQGKSIIINVKGYEFTLIDDGTIEEGQLACLDIAEGTIQLDKDGYIQGTNSKVQYTGRYIITGTAKEKYIRVINDGTYDITIKDLNIDMSTLSYGCPFNANGGSKATGCYVKLTIEGNNYLYGGNGGAALCFSGATPNVNGVTNGSTLVIQGNGMLKAETVASSGIGAGWGNSSNNNSIKNVSNIIVNSGSIIAKGNGTHSRGIGTSGKLNNIIVNGGNLSANGIYGQAGSDNIKINGGSLRVEGSKYYKFGAIGGNCGGVIITGGTINATSTICSGISCSEGGSIKITGGNILARGKNNLNVATYEGDTLVPYTPKNGTTDLYETQIKLPDVGENKKITKLTTSDGIEYGINDMYTLENGMLYLYLPVGTRTITMEVDGKTYSGTVQTTETPVEVTLSEVN